MLLIVLVVIVTILVSRIFIQELIESTINNLFSKQDIIVSLISKELEERPKLLSQIFLAYKKSDDLTYIKIIKNIKSEMPYCKLIRFTTWNADGVIEESISNFDWDPDFGDIQEKPSPDDIIVSFSNNAVIRIGMPYRDSMNINSIVPVFVDHYEYLNIKTSLFLEINLSLMLYDAKQNIVNFFDTSSNEYTVSLYTPALTLAETTDNYPVVKINPLSDEVPRLDGLSTKDMLHLRSQAKYHRISKKTIELYSMTSSGYIVRGAIPYRVVSSRVHSLSMLIISIGVITLALLLVVEHIAIHYMQAKEKAIRQQIETLQAKLDPHFLFNILNSMVGLVADNNNTVLLKAFRSLSILLRSSIAIEDNHVTLLEELDYIKHYVEIQRLRYEYKFEYYCVVDDDSLLHVSIPRFSIQPIIENCFVHAVAVNGDTEKINIRLSATRSDKITGSSENPGLVYGARKTQPKPSLKAESLRGSLMYIDISNNGVDCATEKNILRRALKASLKTNPGGHIGLALINKEIKLLYGGKFGLELLDTEDDIFAIRIKLPAGTFRPRL
jgi:hypothetical protein